MEDGADLIVNDFIIMTSQCQSILSIINYNEPMTFKHRMSHFENITYE